MCIHVHYSDTYHFLEELVSLLQTRNSDINNNDPIKKKCELSYIDFLYKLLFYLDDISKICEVAVIILIVLSFLAPIGILIYKFVVIIESSPLTIETDLVVGTGNNHPLLLNPSGFESVSFVTVSWPFPRAESISVYKLPCEELTTSNDTLPTQHYPPMSIAENSRLGLNYHDFDIPINLAPGSTITYEITVRHLSELSANTKSAIRCLRVFLIDSQTAYYNFLALPDNLNFIEYVSRSHCLSDDDQVVFNITFQSYFYVGIESPDDVIMTANVNILQVFYNLSDATNECPHLSIDDPSCKISICENWKCADGKHTCVFVTSTSPDVVSFSATHDTYRNRIIHPIVIATVAIGALLALAITLTPLSLMCIWCQKSCKLENHCKYLKL